MDSESFPAGERSRSAREVPCPYCRVAAGVCCRTASGVYYPDQSYVHIDRLITMYRGYFVDRHARELTEYNNGFERGRTVGWREGVLDARYTFEHTLVMRGCLAGETLGARTETPEATTGDRDLSALTDESPTKLRSVRSGD